MKFNINPEDILYLPCNVYWKNTEGYYLGCNDNVSEFIGLKNRNDFIGLRLQDFCQKQAADLCEETDKKIMERKYAKSIIEQAHLLNNVKKYYLSIKLPLYSNSNIVAGLLGISFDLKTSNSSQMALLLSQLGLNLYQFSQLQQSLALCSLKDIGGVKISKREVECLYYLKQGRTSKEIARFLKIDYRTVEFYISNIKVKLNCHTKKQLLDKIDEKIFVEQNP